MTPPRTFWCGECRAWTYVDTTEEEGVVACEDCGEPFTCSECGFEISRAGECLRNESGPAEDVGRCPNDHTEG